MTSITTESDLSSLVSFPYLAQQISPLTDIRPSTIFSDKIGQDNMWSISSNTRGHIASDMGIMISNACEGGIYCA